MYKVGGCVRDAILGVKSKDIDFSCEASSFSELRDYIASIGTIFMENEQYLTIRAKVGKDAADFVLARKDGHYHDGRRPESVTPGLLIDDLRRRDFTMNAIAQSEDGSLVDPFNGVQDIGSKLIRCVGSTKDRFDEDSLRMLRAIRFSITKGFRLDFEIVNYIINHPSNISSVSSERIREELHKCFSFSTLATLQVFDRFHGLRDYVFEHCNIWLRPTSENP